MKSFRDLMVWEKAHALTLASYRGTAGFPRQEMYGLISQVRRCSASITANIAEGCGKRSNASSSVTCTSPPDRPANSSIISYSPRISVSLPMKNTKSSISPRLKSRECWLV